MRRPWGAPGAGPPGRARNRPEAPLRGTGDRNESFRRIRCRPQHIEACPLPGDLRRLSRAVLVALVQEVQDLLRGLETTHLARGMAATSPRRNGKRGFRYCFSDLTLEKQSEKKDVSCARPQITKSTDDWPTRSTIQLREYSYS